ncbi:MAG: dockerin type I domain-containing protein, partial [Pirellula sp.]
IDALILVNKVNTNGGGALGGGEGEGSGEKFYVDVNEDGFLSPLDILWVVNRINGSNFSGEGEGEGQVQATPIVQSDFEVEFSTVNPPIEIQSNRLARTGTPSWVINSVVDPSSVDDLLAGYSAQEEQEDNVSELVDDLFAGDLI